MLNRRISALPTARLIFTLFILASQASLGAGPPTPAPLPEPVYAIPLLTSANPTSPTGDSFVSRLAQSAQQPPNSESPTESDSDRTANQLLKFPSLSSVSLSNALATENLKGESLPVPDNEAKKLMSNHGTQSAAVMSGAPSLHFPQRVYYQPLYFEDPNLERCGRGHGIATELVSAVRFFGRAPLVPYMVGSQDPHQCVCSLGDCPACHSYGMSAYLPPLNAGGIALQTAAVVGVVFVLP